MSVTATLAAPFPYFGGKRRAAPIIWGALGDPSGYVEPFAGSAAVLLARPAFKGRRVETINDADGWLINTWRAIQLRPSEVAAHAWGPKAAPAGAGNTGEGLTSRLKRSRNG